MAPRVSLRSSECFECSERSEALLLRVLLRSLGLRVFVVAGARFHGSALCVQRFFSPFTLPERQNFPPLLILFQMPSTLLWPLSAKAGELLPPLLAASVLAVLSARRLRALALHALPLESQAPSCGVFWPQGPCLLELLHVPKAAQGFTAELLLESSSPEASPGLGLV